jgi:DNA-binding response OmpR family regulator
MGDKMLKVMIAEDDLMIADMIEEALAGAGYETCGIARTVTQGVALGRLHHPDLAIVDMRLAEGDLGTDIVAQLADLGMGVLYASGNVPQVVSVATGGGCIAKPYQFNDLLRALDIVAGATIAGIVPTAPLPYGFIMLENRKSL